MSRHGLAGLHADERGAGRDHRALAAEVDARDRVAVGGDVPQVVDDALDDLPRLVHAIHPEGTRL